MSALCWTVAISGHPYMEYPVVIVDVDLETENGLGLIEMLRQSQPDIDCLSITENNTKAVETRARELRVLYHLVKPFNMNELISVLKHTVNRDGIKSPLFKEILNKNSTTR